MNGIRPRQQPPAATRPLALDSRLSTLDAAKRGFTLVELMVVIVIIALLVGLILPAVFAAMATARVAEVRTEISQFDAAIASFKAEFGMEPPSQIIFPAAAADWSDASVWDARSRAIIRRLWPQFDFANKGGAGTSLTGTLNGAECLVFFLGGVRDGTNGPLVGFSKNPGTPFDTGGNRVGPFFEFDVGRLTATGTGTSGNINAPEYLDTLPSQTSPYIYYSSYDGKGYRTTGTTSELIGGMTDVYRQASGSAAHKPNSHQIISPGRDGEYGTGGVYDPDNAETQLVNNDANSDGDFDDAGDTKRDVERDNITNFSSGQLVP